MRNIVQWAGRHRFRVSSLRDFKQTASGLILIPKGDAFPLHIMGRIQYNIQSPFYFQYILFSDE